MKYLTIVFAIIFLFLFSFAIFDTVNAKTTPPTANTGSANPTSAVTPLGPPAPTNTSAKAQAGNSTFGSAITPPNLPTYGPSSWPAVGKKIMDFMGWIAGTIFVGVLLIGAVMYIVAGTNEQSAETGKKAIYAAIIGIAVTALAWTIVTFVANQIK